MQPNLIFFCKSPLFVEKKLLGRREESNSVHVLVFAQIHLTLKPFQYPAISREMHRINRAVAKRVKQGGCELYFCRKMGVVIKAGRLSMRIKNEMWQRLRFIHHYISMVI